jgi:hypothetical protein
VAKYSFHEGENIVISGKVMENVLPHERRPEAKIKQGLPELSGKFPQMGVGRQDNFLST